MTDEPKVTVKLTKTEALALLRLAEDGLLIAEHIRRIARTATAERAVNALRHAVSRQP